MAEAIAIILEYLRRHNFTMAEAALRAELLVRQGANGSNHSASSNELDLNLSLLTESSRRGVSCYSEKVFQDARLVDRIKLNSRSGSLYEEPRNSVLADCGCKDTKFELFIAEKLIALGSQAKEPELQSESSCLPSGVATTESKIKIERSRGEDAMKAEDIELKNVQGVRQDFEGLSGVIQNQVVQRNYNDMGHLERIIGFQNDTEEKSFETRQKDRLFSGSRSRQQLLETQLGGMKSSKQVKHAAEYQDLHFGEGAHSQRSMEAFHQAPGSKATKRWEELDGLSLHEARDDVFQPDIGMLQLEKATIVQESGDLFGRSLHPCDEKAPFHTSLPSLEWPENQLGGMAGDYDKALIENGWVDHEQPRYRSSKSAVKAPPVKTCYPFFSSPSDEQQQEEKEMNRQKVKGANAEDKDMDVGHAACLVEAKLPWEANFPSAAGILGSLEDKKATSERAREELPSLPHVRLRSMGKGSDWSEESALCFNFGSTSNVGPLQLIGVPLEPSFELGSYLDVPMGQDLLSSGSKRPSGSSRPSVSQGIAEETPELLSGFATSRDAPNDFGAGYPHEYWESDGYDDDDDPGYHRQPIEDEAWFLAHEIDYPSDDERSKSTSHPKKDLEKPEDDDHSLMEEESYFSGEQFYKLDQSEPRATLSTRECSNSTDFFEKSYENDIVEFNQTGSVNYDGQLMDAEECNLMRSELGWQGFVSQNNHLGREKIIWEMDRCHEEAFLDVDEDRQGSVRSGGVGVGSDMADYGSEVRDSLLEGSSEGDAESIRDPETVGYMAVEMRSRRENSTDKQRVSGHNSSAGLIENDLIDNDTAFKYCSKGWDQSFVADRQIMESSNYCFTKESNLHTHGRLQEDDGVSGFCFGGFSFFSPSSTGDMLGLKGDSRKSITPVEDLDAYGNGITGPDDTLASWKRKSNESSPILSPRGGTLLNLTLRSNISRHSSDCYVSRETREDEDVAGDDGEAIVADDEETAAVQEQIRQIKAEEDDYEVFNLRIIHRRNRTGFEEDKNFPVVINSVIAGRYHVTEYLGSAAFSKAIQAHDLHTGQDVCMKIIKNNKDFFDQSLDEIKLLKFINRHDPADKYHILRLFDYFYYREHLFIVCELLRANLYEFHKFNRESGGEVYFTVPRLQLITRQCLEALEFLHNLGLIHCDLKPENILVKSYSRCEVKVIDFGSSCFQRDHLCPYVQSRSYRAPEVVLGLSYNQKIDIWSLGCILAELCSGNVLFQNDSLATLLARVVGIIGPIDPEMLAKGCDIRKYFTKNHMLFEKNPDTNQLEYLLPKKTSLRYRLPMGDQGFVDFVGYLLQINPENRPSATEALKHPWLSYPYEPISS